MEGGGKQHTLDFDVRDHLDVMMGAENDGLRLGVRLGERADGSELSPAECMERAVSEDHTHPRDRISRKRDPQRRTSISLLCVRTNLGTLTHLPVRWWKINRPSSGCLDTPAYTSVVRDSPPRVRMPKQRVVPRYPDQPAIVRDDSTL